MNFANQVYAYSTPYPYDTSFNLASAIRMLLQWWHHLIILPIPKGGNWFQTNPREHELDYQADNSISSVCYQWERYGTHLSSKFVQDLSLYCGSVKPKSRPGWEYRSCESFVSYDFQNLLTNLTQFKKKNAFEKQLRFLSHWNYMDKNATISLFETSVNGKMTLAYFMLFHYTSVLYSFLTCFPIFWFKQTPSAIDDNSTTAMSQDTTQPQESEESASGTWQVQVTECSSTAEGPGQQHQGSQETQEEVNSEESQPQSNSEPTEPQSNSEPSEPQSNMEQSQPQENVEQAPPALANQESVVVVGQSKRVRQ